MKHKLIKEPARARELWRADSLQEVRIRVRAEY